MKFLKVPEIPRNVCKNPKIDGNTNTKVVRITQQNRGYQILQLMIAYRSCKKFNAMGPKNIVFLEYEKISFEWKFSNFLMFLLNLWIGCIYEFLQWKTMGKMNFMDQLELF
jgi:hypothetical protein